MSEDTGSSVGVQAHSRAKSGRHLSQRTLAPVYQKAGGGPEYLEIAPPPVVRHVGRDCYCEFWDALDYRY